MHSDLKASQYVLQAGIAVTSQRGEAQLLQTHSLLFSVSSLSFLLAITNLSRGASMWFI